MSTVRMTDHCITFGPFALHPRERKLLKDAFPVTIGGRAFDILLALIERPGTVLSKAELAARVWPGITVEESSLRVHVARLRAALGDDRQDPRYIVNVAGRGYCFIGAIGPHAETSVAARRDDAAGEQAEHTSHRLLEAARSGARPCIMILRIASAESGQLVRALLQAWGITVDAIEISHAPHSACALEHSLNLAASASHAYGHDAVEHGRGP